MPWAETDGKFGLHTYNVQMVRDDQSADLGKTTRKGRAFRLRHAKLTLGTHRNRGKNDEPAP